jgi:hypothetical protein
MKLYCLLLAANFGVAGLKSCCPHPDLTFKSFRIQYDLKTRPTRKKLVLSASCHNIGIVPRLLILCCTARAANCYC